MPAGLEGIVSKRRELPYSSGRSRHWIKSKNQTRRRRSARPKRIGKGDDIGTSSFGAIGKNPSIPSGIQNTHPSAGLATDRGSWARLGNGISKVNASGARRCCPSCAAALARMRGSTSGSPLKGQSMVVRKAETFPPVTMGHIRGHGCRELLVYCGSGRCHHSAAINADWLPDDMPVRSAMPADGLHAVRDDRRRRSPGLVAARQ